MKKTNQNATQEGKEPAYISYDIGVYRMQGKLSVFETGKAGNKILTLGIHEAASLLIKASGKEPTSSCAGGQGAGAGHSPLPFEINVAHKDEILSEGLVIASCGINRSLWPVGTVEANAAYIVHACNSLPAYREALERCVEALKSVDPACSSILEELANRKATDWGLVNDALVACSSAITHAQALLKEGRP